MLMQFTKRKLFIQIVSLFTFKVEVTNKYNTDQCPVQLRVSLDDILEINRTERRF